MTTQSSQIIQSLLDAGFSRQTIARISSRSLPGVAAVKMGQDNFTQSEQNKLEGLLKWLFAMKDYGEFRINPAAYYETQVVVLCLNGAKQHTTLHHLYEADFLSPSEMEILARKLPYLYDYNAFSDEFPVRADFNLEDTGQMVLLHHGLSEMDYNENNQTTKIREALRCFLTEGMDEEDRNSRRLAHGPPVGIEIH